MRRCLDRGSAVIYAQYLYDWKTLVHGLRCRVDSCTSHHVQIPHGADVIKDGGIQSRTAADVQFCNDLEMRKGSRCDLAAIDHAETPQTREMDECGVGDLGAPVHVEFLQGQAGKGVIADQFTPAHIQTAETLQMLESGVGDSGSPYREASESWQMAEGVVGDRTVVHGQGLNAGQVDEAFTGDVSAPHIEGLDAAKVPEDIVGQLTGAEIQFPQPLKIAEINGLQQRGPVRNQCDLGQRKGAAPLSDPAP